MIWFLKLLPTVPLLLLGGFCMFGFLATLEPRPPAGQWTCRAIYTVGAAINVSIIAWIWYVIERRFPVTRPLSDNREFFPD